MRLKLGVLVVCGAMMCSGGALAQSYQDHGQSQDNHSRSDHHRRDNRHHYKGMYDQGRHDGWYKRGGRVPESYRGSRYVVTDWRARHLRQPPRGYHYVRSDNGDFLLVAISTGIIASILAQH